MDSLCCYIEFILLISPCIGRQTASCHFLCWFRDTRSPFDWCLIAHCNQCLKCTAARRIYYVRGCNMSVLYGLKRKKRKKKQALPNFLSPYPMLQLIRGVVSIRAMRLQTAHPSYVCNRYTDSFSSSDFFSYIISCFKCYKQKHMNKLYLFRCQRMDILMWYVMCIIKIFFSSRNIQFLFNND